MTKYFNMFIGDNGVCRIESDELTYIEAVQNIVDYHRDGKNEYVGTISVDGNDSEIIDLTPDVEADFDDTSELRASFFSKSSRGC